MTLMEQKCLCSYIATCVVMIKLEMASSRIMVRQIQLYEFTIDDRLQFATYHSKKDSGMYILPEYIAGMYG